MPQLFNYGSCCIDPVSGLSFCYPWRNAQCLRLIFPGGKGLNQSIAAAKAVLASRIGAIGEDGQHLKTLLEAESVETVI